MSVAAAVGRTVALGAAALAAGSVAACGTGGTGGSGTAAVPSPAASAAAGGAEASPDTGSPSSGDISVTGAWVPEPARPDVGAAYMRIRNEGGADDALIAASSTVSAATGIHTTETSESGASVMTEAERVPVPAGGTARLESGGYHLMLMDVSETPAVGDTVKLSLEFDSGTEVEVAASVLERSHTR